MGEVYVHFLGFLWLLAVALFLEIELQLLAKLKKKRKECCINKNTQEENDSPHVDLLSQCLKKLFYFLAKPLIFLANNASRVLTLLTNGSILLCFPVLFKLCFPKSQSHQKEFQSDAGVLQVVEIMLQFKVNNSDGCTGH